MIDKEKFENKVKPGFKKIIEDLKNQKSKYASDEAERMEELLKDIEEIINEKDKS